ncbi:2,3-dihydro-2,3-dihydroxybenzoate dehydrogenase [Actinomadura rudentiformis]|uniref:2,3-dihydro-2,3-dihydroxybenzoate dehydrogenase n=2 Tax=Actinomadura rudentiformis TaxID=359158 RepID=A0A6H9Z015_9ACTN|nr:2,3-dihydro-2,3-dihydroxybenzoate dehydrogenase [Actinomadura rudentiformis]
MVTGAAGGIGVALIDALADAGASIAALDCDGERLRPIVKPLRKNGVNIIPYQVDVSDSRQVDDVVDRVEEELGQIDYLVNAAGVLHPAPVLSQTDDAWRATFAVNNDGVFHVCRAVAKKMVGREGGAIVTVASNAGTVPRTHMAAYAASKAAAIAFTRCLGLELAPYKVRCNIVAPGSTDTPMLHSLHANGDAISAAIAGDPGNHRIGIPLRKVASPADVAAAVVFLLSDRAGQITLQNLFVDGGAALGG